ncbi:nuclear pore complex protein NUP155-like isoform X1 [Zingiber officinale]|uniref:nuclear pore complex protein NUP155-like isoform X1 n=1 Tax=Zingiber officinale TaxID=94328 RepID=UPI001C4CD05A|nr:nuclear pore complex protein NUP155-like isoform X1 [Zingiber officinale]
MSPSASAGMSPAASTSRRLSKPRSMLASPYSTLPKEISNHGLHFCRVAVCRFTDITTMTIQIILCEALSRGGVAEACSVVKRVGSNIYTGVEGRLSLEIIYLHLEMAASQCMNILQTGLIIRARALLAACKVEPKPALSTYDQLLSYGTILPLPNLKLRCLRSVLAVLCEWVGSVFAHTLGTTAVGASPILGGLLLLRHTAIINQGARDKITSLANGHTVSLREGFRSIT